MRVERYEGRHAASVATFNRTLRATGAQRLLPDIPPSQTEGNRPRQECLVAVDNTDRIAGGLTMLVAQWRVAGTDETVAVCRAVTKGGDDREIVLRLVADAQRRFPMTALVSDGSLPQGALISMKEQGFRALACESYYRVCHPQAYLKNLGSLRSSAAWRFLTGIATATGMGAVGILSLQASRRKKRGRLGRLDVEAMAEFTAEAGELWLKGAEGYSLSRMSTRQTLNALYPAEDRSIHRLLVRLDGAPIGWAIVSERRMKRHQKFGDMCVGAIEDCFAEKEHADAVMTLASEYLEHRGVDIVLTRQTHPWWQSAMANAGALRGEAYPVLMLSGVLGRVIERNDPGYDRVHICFGLDGEQDSA